MGPDQVRGLDDVALGLAECPGGEDLVPEAAFTHDPIDRVAQAIDDLVEFEPGTPALDPSAADELLGGLDRFESALGGDVSHH